MENITDLVLICEQVLLISLLTYGQIFQQLNHYWLKKLDKRCITALRLELKRILGFWWFMHVRHAGHRFFWYLVFILTWITSFGRKNDIEHLELDRNLYPWIIWCLWKVWNDKLLTESKDILKSSLGMRRVNVNQTCFTANETSNIHRGSAIKTSFNDFSGRKRVENIWWMNYGLLNHNILVVNEFGKTI